MGGVLQALASARQSILEGLQQPALAPVEFGYFPTAQRLTTAYDAYFRARLQEVAPPASTVCLAAVGGYGRRECSLHADIDVLLIVGDSPQEAVEALAGELFRPLWDMGLDVGHGVRGVADCVALAREDMAVLASLLDLRHVAGDEQITAALRQAMVSLYSQEVLPAFMQWLANEREVRRARHGNAFALLEPHLKAGIGSMREAHAARWLHRLQGDGSRLDAKTLTRIDASVGLLLEVRSRLHAMCGSRQDVIPLELLPDLAARCGNVNPDAFLAVLHQAMAFLRAVADSQAAKDGRSTVKDSQPMEDALRQCAQTGVPLSLSRRHALEEGASFHDPFLLLDQVLQAPHGVLVLETLLETNALSRLLPSFEDAQDRIPYGGLHIHPVGRHSVETLRALERASHDTDGVPERLRRDWEHEPVPQAVRWACLLHDMGKTPAQGSEGHALRGAAMAASWLAQAGAPPALVEEVRFLIAEHLLLPTTAHAADSSNPHVISRLLARLGPSPLPRLRRLLLLTYADCKATGPRVWNEWSASLLFTLADALEKAIGFMGPAETQAAQALMRRRDAIRALHSDTHGIAALEGRLEMLSTRYLLGTRASRVLEHVALVDAYTEALAEACVRLPSPGQEQRVAVLTAHPSKQKGPAWNVDVVGACSAPLFRVVSGVLALHGLDIMQADVFHIPQENLKPVALFCFKVSPPPDPLYAEEFWSRVRSSVTFALSGKVQLAARLAEKRHSILADTNRAGREPPQVSAVFEDGLLQLGVSASDRVGLLYDWAMALEDALAGTGAAIQGAKVQVRGQQACGQFQLSVGPAGMEQDALCKRMLENLVSLAHSV